MSTSAGTRSPILDLVLDKHGTVPLYVQLKYHILHLISSGVYQPGTPLPSVRQLSGALGLATATVQRTYGELRAQGLLLGQIGRGVFVANLTAGMPDLASERSEVLRDLLARTVSHARSLGFKDDEIISGVGDLVRGSPTRGMASPPSVVLVAPLLEFAEKYRSHLRDALAALGVSVNAVLLSDLDELGDAVLEPFEPIGCLVSLVSTFPDLRRLAGHRGTPLFGLVVDLSEETQHELVLLPNDALVGLVAEDHYVPSARALVRQYRGSEDRTIWAGHRNRRALRRILEECPIILHTLGSRRLLEGHTPAGTQLVELRYRPNAASLARLRALLAADGSRTEDASGTCEPVATQGPVNGVTAVVPSRAPRRRRRGPVAAVS